MDEKQRLPSPASASPTPAVLDPVAASSYIVDEKERRSTKSSSEVDAQDLQISKEASEGPVGAEKDFEYPPGHQVALIIVAILLALFLVSLDRTIIATAIPQITNDFHSLQDIGWYGSAYMLTSCCAQLLLGKVYTFYSPKWVFLTIILIFEIGSAICGAAPNTTAFIFGRAIAGIGSAGIMSGCIILMVQTVPLAKRPMYQGFFGAVFGVSAVIGPLLGGAFTTNVTWRWCFYINLPVGGLAMAIIFLILKPTGAQKKGLTLREQILKLDPLGNLFLLPSIVCLLLALQWGGSTYSWSDGRIVALFTLFGVFLVAFIMVQVFMQDTATIPMSIISNRSIIAGFWFITCLASSMMVLVYYIPVWFQVIEGVTAVESGIRSVPLVLSLVVGAIGSGQIVGRIGFYTPLAIASSIIMPIGAGMITTFSVDTSHQMWIGYQILFGFGLGLGMQQAGFAAQTVLNRIDVPTGVSLMFFGQMLGGAIFVCVAQNVLETKLVKGLAALTNLDPAAIVQTGATEVRGIVSAHDLPQVLQIYNEALRQTFVVATALACLSIFGAVALEWRSVKGQQGPAGAKAKALGNPEADV